MKKTALVDVDSTLWDFTGELIQRMRQRFPNKDIPDDFSTWEEPESFFDNPSEAHELFEEIHQNQHSFGTFEGANHILNDLRSMDYHILIASNRQNYTKISLMQWLHNHKLKYDEIFCELDKSVLFKERDIDLVIDDAPYIQEEALKREIPVLTLRYKYNMNIRYTHKFDNLLSMHEFMINSMMIG